MKFVTKRILSALAPILLVLSLMLCGCLSMTGGSGDWTYSLPNDYCVVHINNYDIRVDKTSDTMKHVIDRYIICFCYGTRYLGFQQIPIEEDIKTPSLVAQILKESNPSEYHYFLVDSKTDEIYGPFELTDYHQKCDELGVTDLCDWIKTADVS